MRRVAQHERGADGRSIRPPVIADGDDISNPLFCGSSAESADAKPGRESGDDNNFLFRCITSDAQRCSTHARRGGARARAARVRNHEGTVLAGGCVVGARCIVRMRGAS